MKIPRYRGVGMKGGWRDRKRTTATAKPEIPKTEIHGSGNGNGAINVTFRNDARHQLHRIIYSMFLSPEVIIVSEFPRDSLEERQPPANTLFSTYFDTADVFSLSRIFRCRTHTILESSSKPREILCLCNV